MKATASLSVVTHHVKHICNCDAGFIILVFVATFPPLSSPLQASLGVVHRPRNDEQTTALSSSSVGSAQLDASRDCAGFLPCWSTALCCTVLEVPISIGRCRLLMQCQDHGVRRVLCNTNEPAKNIGSPVRYTVTNQPSCNSTAMCFLVSGPLILSQGSLTSPSANRDPRALQDALSGLYPCISLS